MNLRAHLNKRGYGPGFLAAVRIDVADPVGVVLAELRRPIVADIKSGRWLPAVDSYLAEKV